MCKYCKRLKELKELDEKEYKKVIHHWRQRDYKARKLMSRLIALYFNELYQDNIFLEVNKSDILSEAYKFIHSNWILK